MLLHLLLHLHCLACLCDLQVQLAVDREYQAGEPLTAWCGPQVGSRVCRRVGL